MIVVHRFCTHRINQSWKGNSKKKKNSINFLKTKFELSILATINIAF